MTKSAHIAHSDQLKIMDQIFPSSRSGNLERHNFFTRHSYYDSVENLPAAFQDSISALTRIRDNLLSSYEEFRTLPEPGQEGFSFDLTYGIALEFYVLAAEKATTEDLVLLTGYHTTTESAVREKGSYVTEDGLDLTGTIVSANPKMVIRDE